MNPDPFEQIIRELGDRMGLNLKPDNHQSCNIVFEDGANIQIDLHSSADKVLMGSQLERLTPGPYRERIFTQALKVNGAAKMPQGILAFSEKNDTLVLFQFITIATLNGEKLFHALNIFLTQVRMWTEALQRGEVPTLEEDAGHRGSGFYGLKP